MPRAINQKLAAAWRAAGFPVSESGKVFTPSRELRPATRPPGFAQLPAPALHRGGQAQQARTDGASPGRQHLGDPGPAQAALHARPLWQRLRAQHRGQCFGVVSRRESPRPARSSDDQARDADERAVGNASGRGRARPRTRTFHARCRAQAPYHRGLTNGDPVKTLMTSRATASASATSRECRSCEIRPRPSTC